jgi:uncharacterized protein
MKSKLLATAAGQRTFAVIFDTGDEIMAGLQAFAREHQLAGSHFTAVGACREVTLGYFEPMEPLTAGTCCTPPCVRRWR